MLKKDELHVILSQLQCKCFKGQAQIINVTAVPKQFDNYRQWKRLFVSTPSKSFPPKSKQWNKPEKRLKDVFFLLLIIKHECQHSALSPPSLSTFHLFVWYPYSLSFHYCYTTYEFDLIKLTHLFRVRWNFTFCHAVRVNFNACVQAYFKEMCCTLIKCLSFNTTIMIAKMKVDFNLIKKMFTCQYIRP